MNKSYTTIEPALLTRTEIDWLLGKIKVSKSYEYKLKSSIKRKIKNFRNLELPLLAKKGFISHDLDLTVFTKNLSANSNDNQCGRWDLNPRTPKRLEPQSSAFGHAGRPPHSS